MPNTDKIPVIDLFAGPGGLGEGFSSFNYKSDGFKIALSIEKEENAHKTLTLRAFYRQFRPSHVPDSYYDYLRGELSQDQLFETYPEQAENAKIEAMKAELGVTNPDIIDSAVRHALRNRKTWILIGGPPCQAYSLAGRSRNKGIKDYSAEKDQRHFLYLEYLRILAEHRPPVFVMENVKGILSSRVNEEKIFERIVSDLKTPWKIVPQNDTRKCSDYHIYSLVKKSSSGLFEDADLTPEDFIIKSELYGIPQSRHRVILLGIREDFNGNAFPRLVEGKEISVRDVLRDLPKLRSGLSREDSPENWLKCIKESLASDWIKEVHPDIRKEVKKAVQYFRLPRKNRGGEYIQADRQVQYLTEWFYDNRLEGACNHSTRGHIPGDIHRYLFAACFAQTYNRSPVLEDFPVSLRPNHKNVKEAIEDGSLFSDRFRVQLAGKPSTTITSHISKDGHYYIHYDPYQCRSLTVREAARLQTFPDNYFFCGPRTAQYHQVGNAVPPYLAHQIASIVWKILEKHI